MQTATYEIAIEAAGFLFGPAGFLFSPRLLAVAAAVWLLLATGIMGRVVQHLEELPHLLAAEARLGYSHPPVAAAKRVQPLTANTHNGSQGSPPPAHNGTYRAVSGHLNHLSEALNNAGYGRGATAISLRQYALVA